MPGQSLITSEALSVTLGREATCAEAEIAMNTMSASALNVIRREDPVLPATAAAIQWFCADAHRESGRAIRNDFMSDSRNGKRETMQPLGELFAAGRETAVEDADMLIKLFGSSLEVARLPRNSGEERSGAASAQPTTRDTQGDRCYLSRPYANSAAIASIAL